ncbi:Wwp1 [Symbiodinium natans]|uniref:Wwp1 protein n=1 Tax=Symbiodinium natans TaxID=878477 RepID=A0A812U716_9DINO|nr:Wwp1 [Symbiodinium natans]
MAASGGVFAYKHSGQTCRWHVRFPGTTHKDFVASVGNEEREDAEVLLAILRSLEPAERDNKALRDICKKQLSRLQQERWRNDTAPEDAPAASRATSPLQLELDCELCYEVFNETDRAPVVGICGHTFCQACIKQLMGERQSYDCPTCRKTCKSDECAKNIWLVQNLAALLQQRDSVKLSVPACSEPPSAKRQRTERDEPISTVHRQPEFSPQPEREAACPGADHGSSNHGTDSVSSSSQHTWWAVQISSEPPLLPSGWSQCKDAASGRVYYCNERTRQSFWDLPAALPPGWDQALDKSSGRVYYYNERTGERFWDLPAPLPPGWDQALDKSSGRVYYYNARTGERFWDLPAALPPGWDQALDKSRGRVYYYNARTGERSWDLPAALPPGWGQYLDKRSGP